MEFPKNISPPPAYQSRAVSPAAALPKEGSVSRWHGNHLSSRAGWGMLSTRRGARQADALTWKVVLDKGVVKSVA